MNIKKAGIIICLITVLIFSGCTGEKDNQEEISTITETATLEIPTETASPIPTLTATPTITPTPTPQAANKLFGVNLGPYLQDDPNYGVEISKIKLDTLIENIAPYTKWIRTYSSCNGLENAGSIAHEYGLKIAAGAWLGQDLAANEKEMASLIELAQKGEIDMAVVGNEVLLRGDLTERELLIYIERFKEAEPSIPVTTAESWKEMMDATEIINAVDVVSVNVYPYWDGVAIEDAAATFRERYEYILPLVDIIAPGKEIWISETGWPACGERGDLESARRYLNETVAYLEIMDIPYFWFEAYNETWKSAYEGEAGACWGIWDSSQTMKKSYEEFFLGIYSEALEGTETSTMETSAEEMMDPELIITELPPIGSTNKLKGVALDLDPDHYRVAVYIYVQEANGWWIKPYNSNPLTVIRPSGDWACKIATGGMDAQAVRIAAFLVPADYEPPLANGWDKLPSELYEISPSYVVIDR